MKKQPSLATRKAALVKKLAKQKGIKEDVLRRLLLLEEDVSYLNRNVFPLGK